MRTASTEERSRLRAPLLLATYLLLPTAASAQNAAFAGLGDLAGGDFASEARDVSHDGSVVVGQGTSATGAVGALFTAGSIEGFGDLTGAGIFSWALCVSADGNVACGVASSPNGLEAFVWEDGMMQGLGDLPGGPFLSEAYGISDDGRVITGEGRSASGTEAFRWEDGVMEGLGDLPGGPFYSEAIAISGNAQVIVGGSKSASSGLEAFRWDATEGMVGLGDLEGGAFDSQALSVNRDGSVIVGIARSNSGREAFRWADGAMEGLGDLSGGDFFSFATDVSDDGHMVIGRAADEEGFAAFLWTVTGGMRDLKTFLEGSYGLNLSGWSLTAAQAVSADGRTIVGLGTNPQGDPEGWSAVLPPACSDLLDNDGDGFTDFPNDPGCKDSMGTVESPACNDGRDNDGDGKVDFDGGTVALGAPVAEPDPTCRNFPFLGTEKSSCALGAGLAPMLLVLGWRLSSRRVLARGCRPAREPAGRPRP